MDAQSLALLAAGLLGWVAIVHVTMASGVRRGELVWGGKYPRLLAPELRRLSLFYALALLASGWVLAAFAGLVEPILIPEAWMRSAGFVVTVFLGVAGFLSLTRGGRWERWFFTPITLFGAALGGWLTFGL